MPGSGDENATPLTDFEIYTCDVCGRSYSKGGECHNTEKLIREKKVEMTDFLIPDVETKRTELLPLSIRENPRFVFSRLHHTLKPLLQSHQELIDHYENVNPLKIKENEWIQTVIKDYWENDSPLEAALESAKERVQARSNNPHPQDIFGHMVFLAQYGLIPSPEPVGSELYDVFSQDFEVNFDDLESNQIRRRRVDRSKVFTVTEEFKSKWGLELVDSTNLPDPKDECDPFNRVPVYRDSRDHNFVVEIAKQKMWTLEDVDWSTAPHMIPIGNEKDAGPEPTSILGFDVAGFRLEEGHPKLRHLLDVVDLQEPMCRLYSKIKQLNQFDATGILVTKDREQIYDLLHYLSQNSKVETPMLPEKREEYYSIPNVEKLHEKFINHIDELDGVMMVPRRKFINQRILEYAHLVPGLPEEIHSHVNFH